MQRPRQTSRGDGQWNVTPRLMSNVNDYGPGRSIDVERTLNTGLGLNSNSRYFPIDDSIRTWNCSNARARRNGSEIFPRNDSENMDNIDIHFGLSDLVAEDNQLGSFGISYDSSSTLSTDDGLPNSESHVIYTSEQQLMEAPVYENSSSSDPYQIPSISEASSSRSELSISGAFKDISDDTRSTHRRHTDVYNGIDVGKNSNSRGSSCKRKSCTSGHGSPTCWNGPEHAPRFSERNNSRSGANFVGRQSGSTGPDSYPSASSSRITPSPQTDSSRILERTRLLRGLPDALTEDQRMETTLIAPMAMGEEMNTFFGHRYPLMPDGMCSRRPSLAEHLADADLNGSASAVSIDHLFNSNRGRNQEVTVDRDGFYFPRHNGSNLQQSTSRERYLRNNDGRVLIGGPSMGHLSEVSDGAVRRYSHGISEGEFNGFVGTSQSPLLPSFMVASSSSRQPPQPPVGWWRQRSNDAPALHSTPSSGPPPSRQPPPPPGSRLPLPNPLEMFSSFHGLENSREEVPMVAGTPFIELQGHLGSEDSPRLTAEGLAEILLALERVERDEYLTHEQLLMLEATLLLGGMGLHDQHRDWRLDVDNMSYEELLALEERIGNVSTGLSEGDATECLKRSKYSSHNARLSSFGLEEQKCSICQEEYEDGDDLGKIECGHSYHVICIQQWLTRKNQCPICKASAFA